MLKIKQLFQKLKNNFVQHFNSFKTLIGYDVFKEWLNTFRAVIWLENMKVKTGYNTWSTKKKVFVLALLDWIFGTIAFIIFLIQYYFINRK